MEEYRGKVALIVSLSKYYGHELSYLYMSMNSYAYIDTLIVLVDIFHDCVLFLDLSLIQGNKIHLKK